MRNGHNEYDKAMRRAIVLAARGQGWTSPNPMVGAVIMRDGRILGEGWHQRYGGLHAEREALKDCVKRGETTEGATMIVTLEPCCHQGKQPPCTEAIAAAGITRVVTGSADPNPLVNGGGVTWLREHGIEVFEGALRAECDRINPSFFHWIRTGRPYVTYKTAMTLDGKTATRTGASQWVTGKDARQEVMALRHVNRAIMVGVGTVLADDPSLTCRMENGRDPIRIIVDTDLRTPLDAAVVATASTTPTWLATCCIDESRRTAYRNTGCVLLDMPKDNGRVDLSAAMGEIGQRDIDSLLLEGGGTLAWSMLHAGLVNHIRTYVAPKIFGGKQAHTPVEGLGIELPSESIALADMRIRHVGDDLAIDAEVA